MSKQKQRQDRAMELLHLIGSAKRTSEDVAAQFTFEEIKEAQAVAFEGNYRLAWFALDALRTTKKLIDGRIWQYTQDMLPEPLKECDISYIPVPGDEPTSDTGFVTTTGKWHFTGGQPMGSTPFAWRLRDVEPAPVRA